MRATLLAGIIDAPRRTPLLRTRAMRRLTLANALVGLSSSIALPFTSLYLIERVGASAAQIGALLTLSGAAGVLVSGVVGSLSDRLPSRKPLIVVGCVMTAACDVVYAFSDSYPLVLAASVTLLAGAWVAVPQIYARGRELLDELGAAPALSLSALRSMVSVAWIVGPPLAGLVLTVGGFTQLFLLVAATIMGAAALVAADGTGAGGGPREGPAPPGLPRLLYDAVRAPLAGLATSAGSVAVLSAAAVVLLQTANSMHVTTMPLLVTVTLHGRPSDVGLIFGFAAALEIPVMIALGWAAGRYGSLRIMLGSWAFGLAYFALLGVATSTWQVAAAQVLSAVYVPGLVGVSIVYFQELLEEPGGASTLFFNSITAGSTVAGVLWGAVVVAAGYRGAYVACVALTAASIAALAGGRLLRRR